MEDVQQATQKSSTNSTQESRYIGDQNLTKDSALCVMNNFNNNQEHSKLAKTFIKGMFPTVNIPTLELKRVRRVVIWNWDEKSEDIEFRQYAISTAPSGCSAKVKALIQANNSSTKKIPDMGNVEDISNFLKSEIVEGGEGEGEEETSQNENNENNQKIKTETDDDNDQPSPKKIKIKIETTDASENEISENENDKVEVITSNKKNIQSKEQSKIILTEIGPRMTLSLIKIEEGVNDGEVIYHRHISKTEEEIMKQRTGKVEKQKLKAERKAIQEANVKRKEKEKEEHKKKSLEGMKSWQKGGDKKTEEEDEEASDESEGESSNESDTS